MRHIAEGVKEQHINLQGKPQPILFQWLDKEKYITSSFIHPSLWNLNHENILHQRRNTNAFSL